MRSPLHWWMVIPGPIDRTTGGTIYDRRMIDAARAAGDRVAVVSLPGPFPARLSRNDLAACRASLDAIPDQATVCVDGLVMPSLTDELRSLAARCRLVALIHHPTSHEPDLSPKEADALWRAESAVIHAADRVICTSRYTARLLADQGIATARLLVAPPGVDLPAVAPPGVDLSPAERSAADRSGMDLPPTASRDSGNDPTHLLCVANLMRRKGLDFLIEALGDISRLNWILTIVGSDQYEPQTASQLHELVVQHGLAQRVSFVGALSAQRLARLYRETDLFVFPSLYEGYGMVLTEAASYGLPIITTDGGAIRDTVAGLGAEVVPAANAAALAAAIERFLTDDAYRSDLTARTRAGRPQLKSWESAARSFRRALLQTGPVAGGVPERVTESFDADWLSLRELADHRFRSRELVAEADRHLLRRHHRESGRRAAAVERSLPPGTGADSPAPLRILDLASGSGSNLRFIAPQLRGPQHWLLCDMDETLLDHARRTSTDALSSRGNHGPVVTTARVINLANEAAMEVEDRPPDLVTASALLDLVSHEWLEQLIARMSAIEPAPLFLAATVFSGEVAIEPRDSGDDAILAAFHADMRRDKGFGRALGDRAAAAADALLTGRGFQVTMHDSTWQLDEALAAAVGSNRFAELCRRQLQFFADAACSSGSGSNARAWLERRLAQLDSGRLCIRIGHRDLLAVRD